MRSVLFKGYIIFEDGSIYSLRTGKQMKTRYDRDGYLRLGLTENGHQTTYHVHRILALCFLPNPKRLPQVNHKDGNKNNNSLSNLEWCSCRDNLIHALKTSLRVFIPRDGSKGPRDNRGRFISGS